MKKNALTPAKTNPKDFIYIPNNRVLLKYFSNIQARFIYSDNLGLAIHDDDLSKEQKAVLLENLFVSPLLSQQEITPKTLVKAEKANKVPKLTNFSQVLADNPRLFILGAPGSGKTTLISWLMLLLTNTSDNVLKLAIGERVPFALILREMDLSQVKSWQDLCQAHLTQQKITEPFKRNDQGKAVFNQLLESGQALFLLDGLDEITHPKQRKQLAKALIEGFEQYPLCQFVISSRIIGFNQVDWFGLEKQRLIKAEDPQKDADFIFEHSAKAELPCQQSYIAPFTQNQIQQFIQNWFKQYIKKYQARDNLSQTLLPALNQNEGLSELARIPVLLNMLCFIHARKGRLPDGRAELYDSITKTYLNSLDRARAIQLKSNEGLLLDTDDLINVLEDLAFDMQNQRTEENHAIFKKQTEIEEVLHDYLSEKGVKDDKINQEITFILRFFTERSGLLTPQGSDGSQDLYYFTHLSFLEYFCARALLSQTPYYTDEQWHALRQHTSQSWWTETFVLFFEQIGRSEHTAIYLERLFSYQRLWAKAEHQTCLLLSQIIMDSGVKLTLTKRQAWIKKVVSYYHKQSFGDKIFDLPLAEAISCFWSLEFDALELLLAGLKKAFFLHLIGNHISDLQPLAGLMNLKILDLSQTVITDLQPLAGLTNLERLNLSQTAITDLQPLAGLTNLERLYLGQTAITDLQPLAGLTNLEWLYLGQTAITDLQPLAGLTNLRMLYLSQTAITDTSPLKHLKGLDIIQ